MRPAHRRISGADGGGKGIQTRLDIRLIRRGGIGVKAAGSAQKQLQPGGVFHPQPGGVRRHLSVGDRLQRQHKADAPLAVLPRFLLLPPIGPQRFRTVAVQVQLLSGEGRVAGYDLRRLRRRDIPYLRRRIGIVFQDYQLLTDRNVFMNLYYVMKATGWKREDQIRERIDQVLKLVDLEAKSYKMPFELSGGEQQRLVIARALLNDPQVLLADEPTGNLDPVTAEGIMRLFQEIAGRGCAVVMSTHNTALIENYPARAILFAQGKIREVDLKAELG